MYNKILTKLFVSLSFIASNPLLSSNVFASDNQPPINCAWLPWCKWDSEVAIDASTWANIGIDFIKNIISEFIQLIAVIAVFALIFSGIMYLLSMWEDEKVKRAKNWIIYSLIWVLLSVSAWWIINLLNNFKIW